MRRRKKCGRRRFSFLVAGGVLRAGAQQMLTSAVRILSTRAARVGQRSGEYDSGEWADGEGEGYKLRWGMG